MPIGKPFENREAFVMNHDGNILPYGFPGELCIGGQGLAKGYLNQLELTDEKFIVNRYTESLMYRSGDLVKWNNNGDLNFFGRIDNQIQIRGFRVELGEVEKEISTIDAIDDVVVLALEDMNTKAKYLCAYIIGNIEEALLRKIISSALPEYMVPTKYIVLEEFPLTTNGKIDKKALPNPINNEVEFAVEAENERQAQLLMIWQEVLKNKTIGIESNFYSVGGDSIKAIQIASRIQRFDLKLDIRDLFTYPTIRSLEPHLKQLKVVAEQGLIEGNYSLTPIQESFFNEKLEFESHYNQAVMLYSSNQLDLRKTQGAIDKLMFHHDALRTQFYNSDLGVKQKIEGKENSVEVQEFYIDENEIEEKVQKLQASLDIYNGELAIIALFHTKQGGTHILFSIHHLVVDGVSWRIILEDLNTLMSAGELPLKSQSFKKWSTDLNTIVETNQIKKELPYWENVLEGQKNLWEVNKNTDGASQEKGFKLTKELTQTLLLDVNKAYNTEINDILLSSLSNSLERITKQNDNLIFLEGHGREELFEDQDTSRTVGWFTSMFPVKLTGIKETSELIKETKESLRKIPNKGVGYGLLRHLSQDKTIQDKMIAQPEITFNYLGQFDSGDANEGLTISKLSPGYAVDQRNEKDSVVDISGMISNGELSIDISYNPLLNNEQEIDLFLETYESKLLEIINHCKNKDEAVNTASDFESEDLSNSELDDIMDMLDEL
jgi:non-ribosomal peptide synthase protein (TIGR01720 family)